MSTITPKQRQKIAASVRGFFATRTQEVEEKRGITPWLSFELEMLNEYGVTRGVLRPILNVYGLTIKNDELTKKEVRP